MYNTWGMDTLGDTLSGHTIISFGHNRSKMSNLYSAAESGNLKRVQELVEQGIDKNEDGGLYRETPLYRASSNGHLAVVRYLVEQGADIEMANDGGMTPLMVASINGRLEVARYLLEQGANRDKANVGGFTSLHLAANWSHLEIAKLLMVYGADLNVRTNEGRLPIDMSNEEEIKQAIRDEPARRRDQQPCKRCVEQDQHSNAAVSTSAQQDDEEEVQSKKKQPAEREAEEGKVADEDGN